MNKHILMDNKLFNTWTDLLIDEAYDWKQIGISNAYCNKISEPKFGLKLIGWTAQHFEVVDEQKYTIFLLRHQ